MSIKFAEVAVWSSTMNPKPIIVRVDTDVRKRRSELPDGAYSKYPATFIPTLDPVCVPVVDDGLYRTDGKSEWIEEAALTYLEPITPPWRR